MKVAIIENKKIEVTETLKNRVAKEMTELIQNEGANEFYFGSRSAFDKLCYEIISELKYSYPLIRRIWASVEYPPASLRFARKIWSLYEDISYPDSVYACKTEYLEQTLFLMNKCDILIAYFDDDLQNTQSRSSAQILLKYAVANGKRIINVSP